jgi:hypothetical protein
VITNAAAAGTGRWPLSAAIAAVGLSLSVGAGCEDSKRSRLQRAWEAAMASASASRQRARDASAAAHAGALTGKSPQSDEPPEQPDSDAGSPDGEFNLGQLDDVGPAGPMAASAAGIVMVTKKDELVVATLERAPQPHSSNPKATFTPVTLPPEAFYPYAPGPALLGAYAYWETSGKIVRRALAGDKKPELLAENARVGTRVSTPRLDEETAQKLPAVAAYIAEQDDALVAKLWVQGAGVQRLSPEGCAANSVSLATGAGQLLAVALEGRTSMSPVHARTIRFAGGKPRLGKDVVVWVGGTSQQLTEVVSIVTGDRTASAFVPLERDVAHFGLARIHVRLPPRMNAAVSWRAYPNGLDPAPVACAKICGRPTVVYARPTDETPHAPQELHLAAVGEQGLSPSQLVASSRAFANVSLAAAPFGGVVAYVADRRTWALVLTCRLPTAARPKPSPAAPRAATGVKSPAEMRYKGPARVDGQTEE